MKNPHALSAVHILDPGYSAEVRIPDAGRSSLYAETGGTGHPWLYVPGDLEAHLMAEARFRAFRICYGLGHHGYFMPPHRSVYFKTTLTADPDTFPAQVRCEFAGALRMTINTRFVGWWPASPTPRTVSIDLRRFLQPGANAIEIMLFGTAEPTCLRPDPVLGEWLCGVDYQRWEGPQQFPYVGDAAFPHQEKLPSFPVAARGERDGLYDFGVELIGRLRLDGMDPGMHCVFRPGESAAETAYPDRRWDEQEDISLDHRRNGDPDAGERAIRFVRLEHGPVPPPPPSAVCCEVTAHPAAYRGAFACADEQATQTWMHAAYTLRLCMRDVTVDGLKRDRLPWVGDLYLSLLGNAFAFAEHRLFLRTLLSFYHPFPAEVNFSGIFEFTLFWVAAAGNYVLYSGDLTGARTLWPRARLVLRAMERHLTPEGFLESEHANWLFIDWLELPKRGLLLVIQALYLQALEAAALLGRSLGETAEAERFTAQADRSRRQADELFWDPASGCYADAFVDGALTPNGSRHANAFAVLSGVADARRGAEAMQAARANPAAPAAGTPYMRYFENAAYCRAGLPEAMLAEVASYWGGMLKEGATTFWEAYDPAQTGDEHYTFYSRPFGKSLCHAWASGPVALYSSELFGLKPVEPGWKTFAFAPARVTMPWAAVCVPTPAGTLRAEFEGDGAELEIPPGCMLVGTDGTRQAEAPADRPLQILLRRDGAGWRPV